MLHALLFLLALLVHAVVSLPSPDAPESLIPKLLNASSSAKTGCTLARDWYEPGGSRLMILADCGRALWELRADAANFGSHNLWWSAKGPALKPSMGKNHIRVTPERYVHGEYWNLLSSLLFHSVPI